MKRTVPLKSIGPVSSLTESTEIGVNSTRAQNILLRPDKGFRGIPIYHRLFALGNADTIQAIIRALPFTGYPSGIGADSGARSTNKTCALRLANQGKNFLLFYDLTADIDTACRGFFYLGDDGTGPDVLNLDGGTTTWTVLATALNAAARWYGYRTYSQIMLGNGVDANCIAQLNRTATPGLWRKAASNAKPAKPSVTLVAPSSDGTTQANWVITSWGGAEILTLTADEDSYIGAAGNNRIRVTISPSLDALGSALTGNGTPDTDPYEYVVFGGETIVGTSVLGPTGAEVATFINSDSVILGILTASTTGSPLPDSTVRGPTYLDGGSGTGASSGFSDRTVTVFLRYWDPGQEGLGYEGISSDPSDSIIIPAADNKDILVSIPVDATAEGGRFPFIRVYLNFGEGLAEIFNLMDPDNPVPNSAATLTGSIIANASGSGTYPESFFKYNSRYSVTAATSDVFTTANAPANNTPVTLYSDGTMPGGVTAYRLYYVRDRTATTFKLSSTIGGAVVNVSSTGSGTHWCHSLQAHGITGNAPVTFAAYPGGVLPTPLSASSTYYARNIDAYTFRVSATPGGSQINLTDAGTPEFSFSSVSAAVRTFRIGTNTPIGKGMSDDQNRPLPHTHHTIANRQVWRAGITGNQERLYASKPADVDELAPEGCFTQDYATVQSAQSAPGSSEVTALYSDDYRLQVHTSAGIILVDPTDTENRREPQVNTGAINGTSMVVMPDRRIFYLGSDISLIAFDSSVQFDEIVGTASVSTAQAFSYIRDLVDTDAIAANPDRAHLYLDSPSQILWLYLPGLDGTLLGFAYDLVNNGITGPFTFPKVYATCMMEKTRPEIIFTDEAGNLLYYDPTQQPDHSNHFGTQGGWNTLPIDDPIPVEDAGYGNEVLEGVRYRRAYWSQLYTGFWDLGDPENRKAFLGFFFRTISGSRAIVRITFETLSGQLETYTYGDVAENADGVNHRALLMASDSAIRMQIEVLSAEQKKWVIRDIAFSVTPQSAASI